MLSAESFKLGTCALGNLARAISKNTPEADSVLAELKFSKGYKLFWVSLLVTKTSLLMQNRAIPLK
jgi:hypothetical protein